jgi:hypothetical protein
LQREREKTAVQAMQAVQARTDGQGEDASNEQSWLAEHWARRFISFLVLSRVVGFASTNRWIPPPSTLRHLIQAQAIQRAYAACMHPFTL